MRKTNYKKISGQIGIFGATVLLISIAVSLASVQPALGADEYDTTHLAGSWMLTLNPPEGDSTVQPCIFNTNPTPAEPKGTMLCTSAQLSVMEGRGEQIANTIGSWKRTSRNNFELRAVRMVYSENEEVLSRTVALAELQYVNEAGTWVLKGTGKIISENPQGERLQTISNVKLRAEPMEFLDKYDIP